MAGNLINIGGGVLTENPSGLLLPVVTDVLRNSANDATDNVEQAAASFVIPSNSLRIGSTVELLFNYEFTNSANAKNMRVRINNAASGNIYSSVPHTNVAGGQLRQLLNILDANTLYATDGVTPRNNTYTNIVGTGFTIFLTSAWGTQPILGESIRLKIGKINIIY